MLERGGVVIRDGIVVNGDGYEGFDVFLVEKVWLDSQGGVPEFVEGGEIGGEGCCSGCVW